MRGRLRLVKSRTTVRGRGYSQSLITLPRPKLPEKKAVIYFAVTLTERDHVAHSGGTLIMLCEEDRRMHSPPLSLAQEGLLFLWIAHGGPRSP